MSVRVENFVDVNITRHISMPNPSAYDTAVLIDPTLIGGFFYYTLRGSNNHSAPYGSKENPAFWNSGGHVSALGPYGDTFFTNGGKYLHVVKALAQSETSGTGWRYSTSSTTVTESDPELPLSEVIVVSLEDIDWEANPTSLPFTGSGIYQKIYIYPIPFNTPIDFTDLSIDDPVPESVIKIVTHSTISTKSYDNTCVAMAMAAYYTKISLTDTDTIKDYAFTEEKLLTGGTVDTNAAIQTCISENWNCTTYLAGANRNIGGNALTGEDITNLFMRIVLQQELTASLLKLLTSKLKLNDSGIIAIKNSVAGTLLRFVNNGYIDVEKVWTDEDLYIDGELVAVQDNTLPGGFAIHVAPITEDNVKNHTAPLVSILYGDMVGIRKITVTGEVF